MSSRTRSPLSRHIWHIRIDIILIWYLTFCREIISDFALLSLHIAHFRCAPLWCCFFSRFARNVSCTLYWPRLKSLRGTKRFIEIISDEFCCCCCSSLFWLFNLISETVKTWESLTFVSSLRYSLYLAVFNNSLRTRRARRRHRIHTWMKTRAYRGTEEERESTGILANRHAYTTHIQIRNHERNAQMSCHHSEQFRNVGIFSGWI